MMPRRGSRQRRRRREQKGGGELVLPKTFETCPNCGSTRRFSEEALKDDMPDKDERKPVLQSSELFIQPPGKLFPVKVMALMDVCVECGTVYAMVLLKDTLKPQLGGDGGRGPSPPLIPGRG